MAGLSLRLQRARALGHRPEIYLGLGSARGPSASTPVTSPASGTLVQAAFTANAKLDDHHKITAVRISGRPKGRFKGGAQGSHVTAYGVFRDVLESATLGRTVSQAYAKVKTLVQDLKELPGYANFTNKRLPENEPTAIDSDDVETYELQELMSYYLEARDAAGYSAAFLGEGRAKGKGEGSILRRLRELENQGGPQTSELPEATELVAGLYDSDAVDQLVSETSKQNLKKLRRKRARRQHLMTIYQAFPKVYSKLNAKDAAAFPDFSGKISQAKAKSGFDRATQRDLFQNLGVIAVPDGLGGYELTVSGRPAGPFSQSSTMGSHTIAYSLVTQAVRQQLAEASSARDVKKRLLALIKMQKDSLMVKKDFRDELSQNASSRLEEADKILGDVESSLDSTRSKYLDSSDVEQAVEAILLHHNVSPLSAVNLGLANNKGEQAALEKLRRYEGDQYEKKTVTIKRAMVDQVYRLLDGATISRLASNKEKNPNLPGTSGQANKEIAAVLDMFFRYVRKAFPTVYSETKPHHPNNIDYYLRGRLALRLDPKKVREEMEIPFATGKLGYRSLEYFDRAKNRLPKGQMTGKKRRLNDEDAWVPRGYRKKYDYG